MLHKTSALALATLLSLLLAGCNNDSKYDNGGAEQRVSYGALLTQVIGQDPNSEPLAINDLSIQSGGESSAAADALAN